MTKIKICGLQTADLASQTARAGADYIGINFYDLSTRCVTVSMGKGIAAATREAGAIPVAIFVDQTFGQMRDICQETQIQVVQLHGSTARRQHQALPASYQRFYVRPVLPNGDLSYDEEAGLSYCDATRDLVLVDHIIAGQGQTFNWDQFAYTGSMRWGFAGGLNTRNVKLAMQRFQPVLVDVCSGVENRLGEKDIRLIQAFIREVRQ